MYAKTDKITRHLNKQAVKIFNRWFSFDELNVINHSKKIYKELLDNTIEGYLALAEGIYGGKLGITWIMFILEDYNPVTRYVFMHEVERKRQRFAEGVIATKTRSEVDLRYWTQMTNQYAIDITDKAHIQRLKDEGVEYVVWVTEQDDRVCVECNKLDGKVYHIDKIPDKPHYGCRCTTEKSKRKSQG